MPLPEYMRIHSWSRPETGSDERSVGAQTAYEHPFMARRGEIANIVKTMQPSDMVPTPGMPGTLMSVVQRPHENVWTWQPPVSEKGDMPIWVAVAISEALETPDLRLLPDPDNPGYGKLYRRALSDRLLWSEPVNWVPVPDLRITYGGSPKDAIAGFDSWMKDWLYRKDTTITQGMTFICTDGAVRGEYLPDRGEWVRTIVDADGNVSSTVRDRASGRDIPVTPVDVKTPTTYTVQTGECVQDAMDDADTAAAILDMWSGNDGKSGPVLRLMCASMFMRSHPEQCYVVQGPGGTGKSTFTKDLKRHLGLQAMDLSLDLLASPTAMSAENAMLELSRHLLALTDDYDPRFGRFNRILPALKPLTTGSLPFAARQRGADSVVDATPQAVHVITTNYHLPIDDSTAEQRRFMFANILDQRVLRESYLPFREEMGFWPFMLAGMNEWYRRCGDHAGLGDVSYVDQSGLTDTDIQVIRTVIADGFVVPDPTLRGVRWQGLGLKRTSRRIDGKAENVYAPLEDSPLYATWLQCRAAVETIPTQADDIEPTDIESLEPLDIAPDRWAQEKVDGGETGEYVLAGGGRDGKVAPRWQQTVANGHGRKTPDFSEHSVWAQVAGKGEIVIDWDADHTDGGGEHGLTRMERDLDARMGSADFPTPFLERSARGGFHGAYGVPAWLMPYLKKAAVGASVSGDRTLKVDTKAANGGYVIAVGSVTPLGSYDAVRRPVGGMRPDLTQPMLEWLEAHGYLDHELPETYTGLDGEEHHGRRRAKPAPERRPGHVAPTVSHNGASHPDMTPIPEGARNDTLYRWGFGRHSKYPDNCPGIDRDMAVRGRASGLKDREITSIIKSVHAGVAKANA